MPFLNFCVSVVKTLEDFMINDDYKKNILSKLEETKIGFNNFFYKEILNFTEIKKDKDFIEATFLYIVSKNSSQLNNYFLKLKDSFKDIIIIDKKNTLIYKISDTPYPLSYLTLKKEIELKQVNKNLAFIQNYIDPSLDINFQIIGIPNSEKFVKFFKNPSFPMAYIFDDFLVRSDKFPESWLKNLNLLDEQNIYKGLYNLMISPIIKEGNYLGTYALVYPSRNLGSMLILVLKILIIIILFLSIFEINRFIEKKLTTVDVVAKQRLQERRIKRSKNIPEEMDKECEKSLEWISKYIEKTEEKK